ncbi:MAG: hypothetical protein HGA80_04590 [Candidatus Omnitrophica bacterium]|nr:hypothetical protein [Candidatus Omnitrophota bacterium]
MLKKIAHIVVGLPVEGVFDYTLPEEYRDQAEPGMRVLVSFARTKRVGVIVSFSSRSSIARLNPVLALLDESPVFSPGLIRFAEVFALRFGCSLGEAFLQFLPPYLREPKKLIASPDETAPVPVVPVSPEPAVQAGPTEEVPYVPANCKVELIFDRGLNRRWEVLRPLISATLAAGKGVICVVPDATLRAAILPVLRELAEPVVLSEGTDKEEFLHWCALRDGRARMAVGFISAVLTPVRDLGLVVIFEEESPFYKNDQSPFYQARDAALLRAKVEDCRVALVTSAPSLEAWHEVEAGRAELKLLEDQLAPVKFLDLTNFKIRKDTFLSLALRHHMEWAAKENRKVLLYIQAARGVAGVVEEMREQFPYARIAGYDKSSSAFPAEAGVVVATQVIFRHRYRARFDIAVVLDVDWEFHKADYQAAHGVFALTQHLRQMTKEFVLLQTRHMENELLHFLADDDIRKFYNKELGLRHEMGFPPFSYMVALVVRSGDPQLAEDEAKRLYDILLAGKPDSVDLHEPHQDRSAIVRGKFRWCVMAQGKSLKTVMGWVREVKRSFRGKKDTVVTVNVNP